MDLLTTAASRGDDGFNGETLAALITSQIRLMSTLLENDLVVRRGGAKHRLIARCWVAANRLPIPNTPAGVMTYEAFRELHEKKTFIKLHNMFDPILPVEFRA